jgi:hypothetical protein
MAAESCESLYDAWVRTIVNSECFRAREAADGSRQGC